jgi:hypothetical protein
MPTKKIVPKPEIDIVEINQSDLDKSENEDDNGADSNAEQRTKPKVKQPPKKREDALKVEDELAQDTIPKKTTKQPLSQGRLNALAAGRKRAHDKRTEKKKAELEALRLQLKKELEAEREAQAEKGYTKKDHRSETIQKMENTSGLKDGVRPKEEHQTPPQQVPSDPLNTPNEATPGTQQGINRQSRLRIVEDSTMNQHNGFSTYGGFQIPHVGGIIKKLGRKLN